MGTRTEILVIGREEAILQTVVRLVNSDSTWVATVAVSDEEAIEKFHHHHFDVVLLTNGVTDEEDKKLRTIFIHQDPDIIIIQHYGGGSGLLQTEIREALDRQGAANKPIISFTDDVLRSTGLSINIE